MNRRRTSGRETRARLLNWEQGQTASERLAAQILRLEGFEDIEPGHPHGGPDGGKDLRCNRDGQRWICAVYFPRGPKAFSKIRTKFKEDLEAAEKNPLDGFMFITNQELRFSERDKLEETAGDMQIELFHLERIANLLDSNKGYALRYEYLDIEIEKEELISHLADQHRGPRLLRESFSILRSDVSRLIGQVEARLTDAPKIGTNVLVTEGRFLMGADETEAHLRQTHEVHLSAFIIDRYPVTNGDFRRFIRHSPEWRKEAGRSRHRNEYYLFDWRGDSYPQGKQDHPVVWVNWLAAAAFCNWRSTIEGRTPFYDAEDLMRGDLTKGTVKVGLASAGYRLPSEAQYEKAARGGLAGAVYPWGDRIKREDGNYGNFRGETTEVGLYAPNGYGLYDMAGNVKEWCHDWYGPLITKGLRSDPLGPEDGQYKIFKGGSWGSSEEELRCAYLGWLLPPNTNPDFGFRCVRPATHADIRDFCTGRG